ncbi:MAG: septum formation initiator family protein [Flavipsychrobacter sp.]|jgi:cell division protein FtsB|nr:septum formation initiator family protein [Flavipsychrobacter sp.]
MKRALRVITNKYLITAVIFGAWMIYFDQNDWSSMRQRQKELQAVKDNIAYLNTEIDKMANERQQLLTNPTVLEKYAREHYKMKHTGEDVYVIENNGSMPARQNYRSDGAQ